MFSPEVEPVSRRLALQVLALWRAQVWEDVLALVRAAGEGERQGVMARMHRRSSRLGHLFSVSGEVWQMGRQLLAARSALSRVATA
jgi:hypothetical protein